MSTHHVGIIGAGAWGTAIAKILGDKGVSVTIWSYEQEVADSITRQHSNDRYLPGFTLPDSVTADTDLTAVAADKDYLIIATPSLFTLPTIRSIVTVPAIAEGRTSIGILTKGFITTPRGTRLIVETLEDYLPGFYKGNLTYISGPSHAEEVAQGKLTGLISASQNPKKSILFRNLLNSPTLKVFSSLDTIGVQVCGAMKNVVAIAFGMLDALYERSGGIVGDNTESLLLAAGLNEIQTMGMALGSTHPETFTSIAGVGDLDVTCRSQYGRNRRFGREIILENKLAPYADIDALIADITGLGYLPEGAVAARAAWTVIQQRGLKMPVSAGVYKILNREADPDNAVELILSGRSE
ncbi:NAD(P)H-dependent glycerol-3-phosphate dehydrogenase [Spirochaeta africana]|uniref:Glycerol-3-phosphate dehydrogenase [NAD(P)+] n=1 Tax=Spirochaeta africana (strain ATCC 700263 / DSM 8902 / Z-7692) TaxID=889378 RepID=H9UFZ6_SPIAZ|nr:NAD(P)H-dependent glycerol-3-phosphate dehydrogenase [Spirochaeta africana]AFG36439.1 glycerol-3-phosphate dehydrogenase [Spirochaeta africana DSM 8902]